jgi:cytochrome c oxidase cbb3-type subunit 1
MISFGAIYYLVPKLWQRQRLYSLRLVNWHFWLATLGIVVYAAVMWVSGIQQGLMWREYDDQGFLVYSFAESMAAMYPLLRAAHAWRSAVSGGRIWSWPSTSTRRSAATSATRCRWAPSPRSARSRRNKELTNGFD